MTLRLPVHRCRGCQHDRGRKGAPCSRLVLGLCTEEATVTELVDRLGLTQPQVSRHLAVLRAVELVSVRADGRRRWYRVNGSALRPVYDWVRGFEATWNARLDRLDDVLAELQAKETTP